MSKPIKATLRGGPVDGHRVELIGKTYQHIVIIDGRRKTAEYRWSHKEGRYHGDFIGYVEDRSVRHLLEELAALGIDQKNAAMAIGTTSGHLTRLKTGERRSEKVIDALQQLLARRKKDLFNLLSKEFDNGQQS